MNEVDNKKNDSSKKQDKILIFIVVLLIIISIIGGVVVFNKDAIFKDKSSANKEESNNNEVVNEEQEQEEQTKIKDVDLNECLNTTGITYSNLSDVQSNLGLSVVINSDKKSATLNVDWQVFGQYSGATAWIDQIEPIQITGFTKEIKSAFIGDVGQDAKGTKIFYIMSDNTVEYTPIFVLNMDSYGNGYYNMAAVDDADGSRHYETKGAITGVGGVVKLYNVDAANGAGWRTTIGALADGSFYDLGNITK